MNSKPATDKEWIDAVTNGATVTAHPDTIAMIAKDDPQLAERIVPHERIEIGRLVAVKEYKPKPVVTLSELRLRADALERLVQAWKQAEFWREHAHDHSSAVFRFPSPKELHDFHVVLRECQSLLGVTLKMGAISFKDAPQ